MKITHALLAVVCAGALCFGTVVPASATTHKSSVRLSAKADARTVLLGRSVAIRGAVSPASVGPVVLEKLVNQDWVVFARGRTTSAGDFSFVVSSAHRGGAWLLRVVRPATAGTREADSATVRVDVVKTAYKLTVTLPHAAIYVGGPMRMLGTVTPTPPGSVALQWRNATGWHTLITVPVGSNGGFAGDVTLPVGQWQLRAVEVPDAMVAGGESPVVIASVVAKPAYS